MSDLALKGKWLDTLGGLELFGKGKTPWKQLAVDDNGRPIDELAELRKMAAKERTASIGEIIAESDEFISKFLHLVSATATTHPATARMLIVADALTSLITMHYKAHFNRARPTQLVPGLLTPIQHGGHASFPSGHSTQAHVFAALLTKVIPPELGAAAATTKDPDRNAIGKSLGALAARIARNREIAGLHYPSDSKAGVILAKAITSKILLDPKYLPKFKRLVQNATEEWAKPGVFHDAAMPLADVSSPPPGASGPTPVPSMTPPRRRQ